MFGNLFKRLAPGRAAGGIFNRAASGGKVNHLESLLPQRFNPRSSGQITAAFYSIVHLFAARGINALHYESKNRVTTGPHTELRQ